MYHYRFGRAAVRLDRVLAIRETEGDRVRVCFVGCQAEEFDGEDAAALREYVASLPRPQDSPEGTFGAGGVAGGEVPRADERSL